MPGRGGRRVDVFRRAGRPSPRRANNVALSFQSTPGEPDSLRCCRRRNADRGAGAAFGRAYLRRLARPSRLGEADPAAALGHDHTPALRLARLQGALCRRPAHPAGWRSAPLHCRPLRPHHRHPGVELRRERSGGYVSARDGLRAIVERTARGQVPLLLLRGQRRGRNQARVGDNNAGSELPLGSAGDPAVDIPQGTDTTSARSRLAGVQGFREAAAELLAVEGPAGSHESDIHLECRRSDVDDMTEQPFATAPQHSNRQKRRD